MTLDVGHCWVEPVKYDGERWGLSFREQFGWGGPQYYPENWTGTGIVQQSRKTESVTPTTAVPS